ncbi:transglutaminaseTgpA domain-containing protein [Lysinibacillus telephonicus]|uniref:Transglutaminase n=1 Tax=Lysinibacillus telephonicus TaxID=1714840 RepID=A0A431UGS5_9BACI|nr:transglutaminase domain-containing protein [Lysinibacillus telephonicus]RTQ88795.1 transglutaminase [Lysinibacillus telephonicus]
MKKNNFKRLELALYYVVVFFILREWLVPIMELTGTGYTSLILLFIAINLVLNLFKVHYSISWVIKLVYMSWFIVFVYSGQSILSVDGFLFLLDIFKTNSAIIIQSDWVHVTDPFRTLLFFILIWMLIYLIHHWITVRMTIFYFIVLTVFFIATLDTFTEYDGSNAIIKIVLLGLMMTSILFIKRLLSQSNVHIAWFKYIKLVMPIVFLIGLSGIVAILLPKSPPQWPDPVPFIKSAAGQGEEIDNRDGVSKVGYGENDSRLGGSFIADDTVVFLAQAETKQYWRVETKDIYTSKGWEKSDYFVGTASVYLPNEPIYHSLPVGPEEETQSASIQVLYPFEFIIQPYGLKSIEVDGTADGSIELHMDDNSEKLIPKVNNSTITLDNYLVQYSKPVYLYSELKNPTEEMNPFIQERYLQLPETLPSRVRDLAEEIVAGEETPYDKARAIEMYFRQNGFRYSTDNVAVPAEDQDYVDQFLFETKIGYCDNFSTSMVVLLRSIGIPARWVKGFAGGDVINTDGAVKEFQVTNNDAHSWVEAYIPNVGWINFEPTIGFNNTRTINYDVQTNAYQQEELTVDEETEPDETVEEEEEEQQKTTEKNNILSTFVDFIKEHKVVLIFVFIVLVLFAFSLYKLRRKWLPKVYVRMNKQKQFSEASFEAMYLQLLKILELKGFKRLEGQTLQSFAAEVDAYYSTKHMSNITKAYEQFIYAKDLREVDFDEMKESWEYLINQTTS